MSEYCLTAVEFRASLASRKEGTRPSKICYAGLHKCLACPLVRDYCARYCYPKSRKVRRAERSYDLIESSRYSSMVREDIELARRLIDGDEEAFRLVVSAHHGSMKRLARAIVGEPRAEELVQDAWIKAIGALPAFEARSSLRVWLLRIVRNLAISCLRMDRRQPKTESLEIDTLPDHYSVNGSWRVPPAIWSFDTPEALIAASELRFLIEQTLASMPEAQRAVITLKDVEGLPFDDICNVLEISASNARVLLHRARKRLWAVIDESQRK